MRKNYIETHHRIIICYDIIIYRILDLISDDRVELPHILMKLMDISE